MRNGGKGAGTHFIATLAKRHAKLIVMRMAKNRMTR